MAKKPIKPEDVNPNPLPLSLPLPATTTEQDDIITAGQRRVNLIWEITQSILALGITVAFIYCAITGIDSRELVWAFISIVTTYLVRTNHTRIGGVLKGQEGR